MTNSHSLHAASYGIPSAPLKRKMETAFYVPDAPPSVLRVELDRRQQHYTNLDTVKGTVRYDKVERLGRLLTVTLIGVTHSTGQHWNAEQAQYEIKRTEWAFLRHPIHVDLETTGSSSFEIQIPESLQPSQCPVCDLRHLHLPPTLGHGRPDNLYDMTNCDIDVRVVYQIKAEIKNIEDDTIDAVARQQFMFMPAAPKPLIPQIKAYCHTISSTFGKRWGTLVMTADENATIQTSGTAEPVTSSITTQLTYKGPQPPQLSKVEIVLQARTARRITHQHGKEDVNDFAGFYKHKLRSIKLGENSINWRHSSQEHSTWHAELSLPITLSDDKGLVILPSFENCLVSRMYRLNLKLHMTKGSMRAQSIEVSIPITIQGRPATQSAKPDSEMPSYEEAVGIPLAVAPISAVPPYSDILPDFERLRRPEWFEKAQADSLSSRSSCTGLGIAPAC